MSPRGFVRPPSSAHTEGALARLGSPQNPPRAHYRDRNPSGGYSGAAVEKGTEGFQKTVRQVQIFLYPYRAGGSREE